jgi:hypothetical protein
MSDNVNTPCTAYNTMAERWELIHDLLGGTLKMRAAGVKWLPKETAEQQPSYDRRKAMSVLFNGYEDTVSSIADRPFAEPVSVSAGNDEELPDLIQSIVHNADRRGRNLTQFARDVYEQGAIYGKAHILVDFPATEATQNAATERKSGVRASLSVIEVPDLIGWKSEVTESGETVLTEARIKETITEQGEDFTEDEKTRVRVITPTETTIYESSTGDDGKDEGFVAVGDPLLNTLRKVPLITIYFRGSDMVARPPLENLAWLNLLHWQSLSDQRHILRVARVAILFAKGFGDDENQFVIGPDNVVLCRNTEAELEYVEYGSGGAIEAGEKDLDKLEARMQVFGLAPFIEMTSDTTATAVVNSESSKMSKAQAWVRATETGLEEAIKLAGEWQNADLGEFDVDIFSDFKVGVGGNQDGKLLLEMWTAGAITTATLLKEFIRRGILNESLDVTAEADALEGEAMTKLKAEIKANKEVDGDSDGE